MSAFGLDCVDRTEGLKKHRQPWRPRTPEDGARREAELRLTEARLGLGPITQFDMEGLSPQELRCLIFVDDYRALNRRSPTQARIAHALGTKLSKAHTVITGLLASGHLTQSRHYRTLALARPQRCAHCRQIIAVPIAAGAAP